MAARNEREAETMAGAAINKWAAGFASVAWILGSHYAMGAGDLDMVVQIGSTFQVNLDRTAGSVTSVAAPLIGSKIAHSILDFVPVFSWIAKSTVALGVIKVIGTGLRYFRDCSPSPE